MVPLVNITALPVSASVEDAVKIVNQTGFSRIPVYKDKIFNLTGVVYALDLINILDRGTQLEKFVREIPYVPEIKRAGALLVSLQKERKSIAICVDEYGGAVGIITIEDILEEVVGEISDEHDRDNIQITKLGDRCFLISARMEIDYLNEHLKLNIPEDDYETVGGFLLKKMEKIPASVETYVFNNVKFSVRSAGKRSIHEIKIELIDT